ncbi:hypothetical protein SAPIO_CDS7441 [Scedosporium apiospermum]|uniref:Uncharacterized protein n=1 Tax=Pseudallescheria apiosperma TaxID=563466 RepID=A0A084G1X0_PSEDA|nr:uncharacterized protein SAPIO_CDS7441 [Scedosporium apiospermum]KEZ41332.1 hypothetical protein SAPIO_CDS7441 [Scedosporium apiospermum]
MEDSPILSLARKITADAEILDSYLKENDLAIPGLGSDSPSDFPDLPPEIQESRQRIQRNSSKLQWLARGPVETIRWATWGFLDSMSVQIINHFGIASLVPLDGTITLEELGTKTTLDPINLARVLRHAMTNGFFREPTPGVIAHTPTSRLLAQDTNLTAWLGFQLEDIFPAGAHVLEALKKHPEATSLTRTGFNFANGTVDKEPMFVTFAKDPPRAKRMALAMASLSGGKGYEVSHLVNSYDFSDVDSRGGTLVDLGGSHGFACVEIGQRWRNMKFVVQDLQRTIDTAPKPICDDEQVAERITLQAHDFFTDQVVKDADVYFLRWIFHNYSDPYAIKILKSLIPALKPGAKIIINDHCFREPGTETPFDEKVMRSMDLVMLAILNAHERTEKQFEALFRAASDGVLRERKGVG